ncbi:hypothetical protein D3C84_1167330 [compost metagenome]
MPLLRSYTSSLEAMLATGTVQAWTARMLSGEDNESQPPSLHGHRNRFPAPSRVGCADRPDSVHIHSRSILWHARAATPRARLPVLE